MTDCRFGRGSLVVDGRLGYLRGSDRMAKKKKAAKKRVAKKKVKKSAAPKKKDAEGAPAGFKLRCVLRGHEGWIGRIGWSPEGRRIASPSEDGTIRIWDAKTGEEIRVLTGHEGPVWSVAWSADGGRIASGGADKTVRLWDAGSGKLLATLEGHERTVYSVSWSAEGRRLVSGSKDNTIRGWDGEDGEGLGVIGRHEREVNCVAWRPRGGKIASGSDDMTIVIRDGETGEEIRKLRGHKAFVLSVSWSVDGRWIASASEDSTVRVWDAQTGRVVRVVEGHAIVADSVSFSADGRLLASKSEDDTVRVWRTDSWVEVARVAEHAKYWPESLAFGPKEGDVLATLGKDGDGSGDRVIRIWDLDLGFLLGDEAAKKAAEVSGHYRNAKVVLVGDTGVGKSGLGLVLTGEEFAATESTHGRHVYTFEEAEEEGAGGITEVREVLLWDLAGQAGYRLVHQMHLNEVAVALVVFDARSETEPLAGVGHWERALRQAVKRQAEAAVPLKKFLVVARGDRGGVAVSKERIEKIVDEMGFDGYFETSAKAGWGIKKLAAAIRGAIDWDALPEVTSTKLFHKIKDFILAEKEGGRVLCTADQLFKGFHSANPEIEDEELRGMFDTCVSRLQHRDLVRCMSFGGYILLQPELLDGYASGIVNAAKKEPEQMGSIAEEDVLSGRFKMAEDARVKDKELEKLVLIPTVKELVDCDLGLREEAEDGNYLVFPSQFVRDWPGLAEPEGKAVVIRFEGAVANVYATLAVRLAHSGQFETRREAMWRNAVKYEAKGGGECGLFLREFSEGEGELTLFYSADAGAESRYEFEEYVIAHLKGRAISVDVNRLFLCGDCGEAVPGRYAAGRIERGLDWIECGVCGERVSLVYPEEELAAKYPSRVAEMDAAATARRELSSAEMTLRGKIETGDFDVFLCHNSEDKAAVKRIGEMLKERGILPWLDEWELRPGFPWQRALEKQIENIKSVAVFVGESGLGPWQDVEKDAFVREFVRRECPVIPVILVGCKKKPKVPVLLEGFTWVDFRKDEPDPMGQLVWGITGEKRGIKGGRG